MAGPVDSPHCCSIPLGDSPATICLHLPAHTLVDQPTAGPYSQPLPLLPSTWVLPLLVCLHPRVRTLLESHFTNIYGALEPERLLRLHTCEVP